MLMVNIQLHKITVLDFNSIFNKHIESNLIKDLEKFGLIQDSKFNIKNRDVKRFFYHHLINGISKFFLTANIKNKSIILYANLAPIGRQIIHMADREQLQAFLDKAILKISKILPLKWYISTTTFNELIQCIESTTGSSSELINKLRYTINGYDASNFTYGKARMFAKRHGLEFLTNNFFKTIHSKQLILS